MSQDSESDDDGYMCIELPTLIKQLKSVLDQYPDGGQILKELIQNAEDAKASEMRILYDVRHIDPDPRLLKKKHYLASLQAPALCVYNDALFTEKDWRGIKMLHDSVKEEEPLKVGRFGLGFKSVFHVTDFPFVISGDTVLFINPQEKNSDRVCYMKKLRELPNEIKQMILNVFSGIFDFTSATVHKGYYSGTIFWFPLRTNISKLSDNLYTEEKVMDLFQAFKSEASITLLFLKSIEKIQLYQRLSRKIQVQFSLQLSQDCLQHVRTEKRDFMRKVKQAQGGIPASSVESQLTLTVETVEVAGPKSSQQWIVINFYKGGTMSPRFRDLCSDRALSYAPYVGLAVPLGQKCKGHVFCFLPLPLEGHSPTGLQVHVNGFFALNQNRRHVKWPTADQLQNQAHTDKALEWNMCLVSEVLPDVYIRMLNSLILYNSTYGNSDDLIKQIYRMIPDIDDVDVNWKPLVSTLLEQLHNIPLLFTPSHQRMGIKMKDAFLVAKDAHSLIVEIFTLYKRYIVPVPSKIMRTLEKHFSSHIHKVTPKDVCDTLRLSNHFTRLPRQKKLMLLKYLLESDQHKHLEGLCLLPVADGNFVAFGAPAAVFICDQPEDVKLFPGLESQLVSLDLPEDLQQALIKRAAGGWKDLSVMSPATFPGLLQKCLLRHFPEGIAKLPSPSLDVSWLRQVWTYITAHGFDVESVFSGFLIVPDIDASGRGRLHSIDDVFIAQSVRHSESLPPNVGAALQKLGIVHLMYVPDFVLKHSNVLGTIIQYSNPVGVVRALEKVYRKLITAVQLFNSESSKQERSALVAYMSTCQLSEGSKAVLRKLQLFTATDNSDCSVETLCTLAPDEQIPVPYPERYIQCSSAAVRHLALTLGATERPFLDVSRRILQIMQDNRTEYTESHKLDFMEFLMENHFHIVNETRQIASEVRFLSSSGGLSGHRACDLFSRNDPSLRELFLGEDKFPAKRHTRTDRLRRGLEVIGLKTEKEVSESDVRTSAKKIEELVIRGMESEAGRKVTAFITVLKRSTDRMDVFKLSDLQHLQCIPCMQKRISRYPKSLSWKGESGPNILSSGKVFSSRYSSIIGSVSPVAKETTAAVEDILGLDRVPPVCSVMEHLHNLGTSYDSRECNPCMDLLKDIYSFLSSQDVSSTEKNMMESSQSVWVGIEEGFHSPRSVYCERSDADLDLKPYRYQLPSLLHGWGSLLCSYGCHQRQTPDMLATVLEEIKEKHDEFKTANLKKPTVVRQDLKLVLQILNELQEHPQRPDHVLVPVHQASDDFLLLLPAEYCTYCNADWLQDQTSDDSDDDEEEIFFVHASVSELTAKLLNVSSLTDRVMGDTEDFDMNYQQTEPLTRRLKNLLHQYTDGFSAPKELIQNADDAAATEVCFMYDERQNLNARTSLMNENMAALQGPAFWAYNDATFQECDFDHIKKLSGATKEEDTTKVGKFGLGFNSVYNLTDVPSFISENNVVIFDPHKSYLGRPGLRANLKSVKNGKMLRKMSGQFKPFEGIFGCNFSGNADKICPGTLFRFPLRTQEQADASEIKDLVYSRHEMENFFRKFVEGCGNLLLFTQNVQSVKFFHIPPRGEPSQPELLVHVRKTIQDRKVLSPPNSFLNGPNVLSHAAEEWKKQSELSLKISEKSDVQLEICDTDMTRMQKLKAGVTIVSWLITWVTGQGESEQFARSGKLKGLLPLAAVAIPLTLEDGRQCIYNMDKCPEGFYREGHFFCFLPLPVDIPFPVHINAPFALTSDRRQLCTQTEDDKTNSEAEWNTALLKDATCRAYVAGLEQLEITDPSTVGQYYDLWPTMQSGQHCMVRSFYELITHEAHDVFLHDDNGNLEWLSFQRIYILEPNICGKNRKFAYKAAANFWNRTNEKIIDLPQNLLEQFNLSGLESKVSSRLIRESEFFKTIFFRNIHDSYWSNSQTERDSLVLFALKCQDESVQDLIKSTRCIPTEPSGTLKLPGEVIRPNSPCADLFSEEDECFPRGFKFGETQFCDLNVIKILCKLGMIQDKLPWEILVERTRSVEKLAAQDAKRARERSGRILRYLVIRDKHGKKLFDDFNEVMKSTLQGIPFLPILKHPTSWHLRWKADEIPETLFACPNELHDTKLSSLVACSQLMLDDSFDCNIHVDVEVLSWLEVKGKEDVVLEDVANQLLFVSETINSGTTSFNELENMCKDLYACLNEQCHESKFSIIRDILKNYDIVVAEKRLLKPQQVAFSLPCDLSPDLYQVDKAFDIYKPFLQSIGVRERFRLNDILAVIGNITKEEGTKPLSQSRLKWFGLATQYIQQLDHVDRFDFRPEDFDISLPNSEGIMSKAVSLCIDDCEYVVHDESMTFVHQNIHPNVAKLFGVKGKREVDLKNHISSPFSEFGQCEKLTTRLKGLLSGYPCDSSLMKELLQNADDAGATELMFIKDFRHLPTEKLFCDEWASLQGPALCVFNDSFFTEDDFEGIQNLGVGSKSDDPVKTGQYGVGFNAVYHLTDVPSFITVGPGMEKSICALDPHMQYVAGCKSGKRGVRISQLDRIRDTYADSFSGFLEDIVRTDTKGTLFRFPLRTQEMATKSKIKDKKVDPDDVNKLLEEFKNDMFDSLLFLHNVKKISIARVSRNGIFKEYCVEASMSEADMSKHKQFLSHLRNQTKMIQDCSSQTGLNAVSPLKVQLSLRVKDSQGKQQDWIVSHQSGFVKEKSIPDVITTTWKNGDIRLLPRGGVAMPLADAEKNFEGKAFCTLPLPISTGLPVHVNGHFALDHEARRNLWYGSDDYRSAWNRHVVDAVIVPAYISAVKLIKKSTEINHKTAFKCLYDKIYHSYYTFFPDRSCTKSEVWGDLVVSFYTDVVLKKREIFSVIKPAEGLFAERTKRTKENMMCKVEWVPAACSKGFPGYFNNLEKETTVDVPPGSSQCWKQEHENAVRLKEILKDLNMKVIDSPSRIYKDIFATCKEPVSEVTPTNVMHFLKTHFLKVKDGCSLRLPMELAHTSLRNVKSLQRLTQFCKKQQKFCSELQSLPLALTASMNLYKFDPSKPFFVTKFTELLDGTPDQVLHKDIVHLYEYYESPCLKELDICSLAALLGQTLSADVLQTGKPVYWKDNTFPSKQWIIRFWDYLATQIYGSKSNQTLVTKATLTKVEDWSLLPATKHGDGSLMLYPIKESWCVIDMDSVNEKAHQTALHHMNVPQLEKNVLKHTSSLPFDNRACAVASSSLASWENPGTVLKLISNLDFSSWNNVSPQDCQAILEFFSRNVDKLNDPQAAKQLKKIPLYESLGGPLVDLQNHTTIFSVEILMTMPSEGFDDWTSASKILLLKFSASCRKLYHFLGVQELTDEKLYVQYILPNFNFLPDSTKPKHLKYIRDQLLKKATKFSPEQCELIKQLKELKFIEAGDGMLHCAGNFYSSDVEVFREMCQPNELLPPPYSAREWQHFVELAGLKTKVTEELYLLFARKVERSGQQGITENIERKSKALISYLTRHYKHFRNLTEIGKIKFVLPYSVNEELTSIFPQHNEGKYLVSYSESLSPCHCHFVWTSCSIFNQDADPRSWLNADRIQHFNSLLGIQTVPTSERVTRHLQNICTSLINIQDQNDGDKLSKLDHFIQEVMKANYKHLLDTCVTDEMKIHLQDFSIIYVPADKCMVSADRVVKNIPSDVIMKGYLYAIPDEFFEFHQIFIDLGASKDVNANLRVLEKLYKETNGKSLHLNELSVAKKAIDRMFFFMQRESMPDTRLKEQPSLYLPDNSLVLTDSRNLVYNNDKRLSERVEFLELPYFLGFQKLELNMDENALLSMLPECYRLKLLTSFVKEHVTKESKQRAYTGDLAQKYKNIVQGSEFVSAVVRLVNHESILLRTQGLDISEAKDIEQRLALLEIQQVNNLKTELWENGNVVPGSQCKRAFLRERNKRSKNVCLFIDSKIKSITLLSALAVTVDNLTSRKLGSCSAYLHHLLGSNPEIFNGYLDEFEIKPYGHVGPQREQTAFPPPGTLIPEDMHWLLDNSFHVFDEGEYVGLEVYDPLVDTDSQDEEDANANPVYIYAIVKKVVCKEDMLFRQKYVVNVGDDREEEILGLKLYKFWREKTNKCRSLVTTETSTSQDELQNTEQSDLESVLKDIRQILTDTWRSCSDQKERNRVKKRLYLKWHPDKNPGREDFCTKVCQNIQKYVMRLENGQSIEDVDDEDIGTQRTSYGASRTNSSFFEHMNRRSSNQRNHYERHKRTASSSENYRSETFYKWHHSARDDAHPQPQEAKRWLRQATFDLQAAWQSSRQYNTCSNNWVLFKAQQAAEKAIKSVWFNRNANVADRLRNHDITITSRGLNNPQLSELASQLQCLIGDFNRMRYPDRLSFPSIPADVYTDDNARQACQVAQKILNLVKELLDHDSD